MVVLKASRHLNLRKKRLISGLTASGILLISLFLAVSSLFSTGLTYDEYNYFENGKELLTKFAWDNQLIRNHPPLTFYIHGIVSLLWLKSPPRTEIFPERLSMLLVFLIFALSLFFLTKKYFGAKAALFSLILFSFNPEILAHGRLITPDLTLALFIFLFTIFFYEFLKNPGRKTALKSAVFLGLALLSKYTALFLIPISLFSFIIYELFLTRKKDIFRKLAFLLIIYAVAIFIVNLGYGFSNFLEKPGEFKSNLFKKLSKISIIENSLRVFPKPYIQGVDWQLNESQKKWLYNNFFMGKRSGHGFKEFFFLTFLFKTPVPLLIFLLIAVYLGVRKKHSRNTSASFLDFLIFLTIFFFLFYFSFFNNLNIGFRYVLMFYPLLFFFVARIVNNQFPKRKINIFYNLVLLLLVCWYILGTLRIHPYYLAYANELIGGPKNAWNVWADSTLDWGQDNMLASEYFKKHPEIKVNPKKPVIGRMAVNVNSLNLFHYNDYLWLRGLKEEPITNIGYTWLIFDISKKDVQKIKD